MSPACLGPAVLAVRPHSGQTQADVSYQCAGINERVSSFGTAAPAAHDRPGIGCVVAVPSFFFRAEITCWAAESSIRFGHWHCPGDIKCEVE